MKDRPYSTFYARLLGGFSFSLDGQEIPIKGNLRSKYLQFFLMLLKAGKEGITKERLMRQLDEKNSNREKTLNNLRQQIFVLRRTINTLGLPQGQYIVFEKGRYYFSRDQNVITDTEQIDQLDKRLRQGELSREKRKEILQEICNIYSGEFLPMLHGEEWAAVEGANYQNIFFKATKELYDMLKQEKAYGEMLKLCSKASLLHPYDEWQAMEIDCLIAQNRYMEAMKVYEKATEVFYEEFGVSPFDSVIAKYRSKEGQLMYTSRILSEIKDEIIKEDTDKGAYYCSYPSFIDVYRLVSRMKDRQNLSLSLVICTLKTSEQKREQTKMLDMMEELQKVIAGSLRRTDVFTRYSPNQFLILLMGSSRESSETVTARLQRKWQQRWGEGKPWMSFMIEEIDAPKERKAV